MPEFRIEISQVFKVTRTVVIERNSESLEAAIHEQRDNDAPDFTDPRWNETWTLVNEEVQQALGPQPNS